MQHSWTNYYVEVLEDGTPKIVPHDSKRKFYMFYDSKNATAFMSELKDKYPDKQFRRVTERTTVIHGEWK